MIRTTFALILMLLIASCGKKKNSNISDSEIEKLKAENDSLKSLVLELNSKYIFDSISIRDIPSYTNSYKKNSKVSCEIVIVGYNMDNNTNVIFADTISFNPLKIKNPDTLKLENGGFQYQTNLSSNRKILKGIIEANPKYGKEYLKTYSSMISIKDN
ncbi:hypothetical protein [Christiangramia sabulilitoris]|uniref:Uncharacterized protein n=1 Tax=Christiangramia sabulilitoris TaxID=2583991 RepID=A0A550I765_9FLAO|nr:hypothetical protein [Christiangramia sabulilitoris]TRO66812.1 hypothetical protein FGM01_02660 [Christiangramia sabulilitoris]